MFLKKENVKRIVTFGLIGGMLSIPTVNAYANTINNDDSNQKKSIESFQEMAEKVDLRTAEEAEGIIKNWVNDIQKNGFKYEVNKNLSPEEQEERYSEISEKYDVFEKVSDEDAEFLIAYQNIFNPIGSEENNMQTRGINQEKAIKTTQKAHGGVTGRLSGTLKHKGGSAFNFKNYYGGNLNCDIVGGASKVRSVTGRIYHEAWGLAGEQGVIRVYNDKIEYTKNKAPFAKTNMNRTEYYTAYVSVMKTYAKMIVNHSGGTFELYGSL